MRGLTKINKHLCPTAYSVNDLHNYKKMFKQIWRISYWWNLKSLNNSYHLFVLICKCILISQFILLILYRKHPINKHRSRLEPIHLESTPTSSCTYCFNFYSHWSTTTHLHFSPLLSHLLNYIWNLFEPNYAPRLSGIMNNHHKWEGNIHVQFHSHLKLIINGYNLECRNYCFE